MAVQCVTSTQNIVTQVHVAVFFLEDDLNMMKMCLNNILHVVTRQVSVKSTWKHPPSDFFYIDRYVVQYCSLAWA